jgi:hypothetical protein
MRILFLSDNFPPEGNAPATRLYEHAIRWVRSGKLVAVSKNLALGGQRRRVSVWCMNWRWPLRVMVELPE